MLAIIAAILFGLAILLDLVDVTLSEPLSFNLLVWGGLLFIALHMAGLGTGWRWRRGGRR